MKVRNVLGGVLMALPNAALFVAITVETGIGPAVLMHAISAGVIGVVGLGAWLVADR